MMGDSDQGYNRYSDLMNSATGVSQAESQVMMAWSQLNELNTKIKDTVSVAPFEGIIMSKMVEVGDAVQPADQETRETENSKHSLGLAGGMAKAFITSPLALLLLIAFLALGILGMQMTPRQEDPQISVPMVDIFVKYPGATSSEVVSQVARPLEGIMSEITGVKHVYSASSRGQALITVQFKVGEDFETSIVKLHDKIESNKNKMPQGIAGFLVKPVGVDDVPVVSITLWSNDVDDASFKVDGRTDQLLVEILPERLATYGVSLAQVANTIRMANSERNAGSVEPNDKFVQVITGSFLKSSADIKRLMVAVVDGRPRDVATVKEGPSEATKIVGYYTGAASNKEGNEAASGAPAVTLAIAKKHGSNGVEVAESVLKKLEYLKGRLIPDNVHVAITEITVSQPSLKRWLLSESLDVDVAVDAVREVGIQQYWPTFTVIAALLPMGFVSGMMGPYMSPIPILGSVAMLFSLFAAFAFTPWLTNKFKPSLDKLAVMEEKEHRQAAALEKFFRKLIIPLIQDKRKGRLLLFGIIGVKVKMLPLDNKPEFNIVVNFPEGTALPVTANLISQIAEKMQAVEEVTAVQTYAGTASPFNFNGLVRHYYLRDKPWQGDVQIQLTNKHDRDRSSHEIAEEARAMLTPLAREVGARIQSSNLGDVDNFLEEEHEILRFKVDAAKAQRNGISVEDINATLEMAMGGFVLGDIKKNALINPTPIIMQIPLAARSQINRLIQLPVSNRMGKTMPLSELGRFVTEKADQPIYHKDLRAVEFVTAETVGDLAAPVYGMFQVQDLLAQAN
ncbi:Nodulation protein NolG [Nymphon striatum]|nr:Nodulation protein NolG [Nymphon striatum]